MVAVVDVVEDGLALQLFPSVLEKLSHVLSNVLDATLRVDDKHEGFQCLAETSGSGQRMTRSLRG